MAIYYEEFIDEGLVVGRNILKLKFILIILLIVLNSVKVDLRVFSSSRSAFS